MYFRFVTCRFAIHHQLCVRMSEDCYGITFVRHCSVIGKNAKHNKGD